MYLENNFIDQYKEQWDKVDNYITKIEKKGFRKLTYYEFRDYLRLIKVVTHHLAIARANEYGHELNNYLNNLLVRANNQLYATKKISIKDITYYLLVDFAVQMKKKIKYIYLAGLIYLLSVLIGYMLTSSTIQYASYFLPESILTKLYSPFEGINWKDTDFSFFSAFVMLNNIYTSVKALAFGILGGVVTAYILFVNGAILGSLIAWITINNGNLYLLFSNILPHTIVSAVAIIIAGGAGLSIGKSLLIPGSHKRKDAVIKSSKEAAKLIPGIFTMLVLSILIESSITHLSISPFYKLAFSGLMGLTILLYFVVKRN